MVRLLALLLTVLTGFSGLVYEIAWQKYLATLLGSHSEATASVLGIFLGGLSVGYWLFGRVTRRVVSRAEAAGMPPRLLLLYGALEAGIGAYVIAFPWLFGLVQQLSYALPFTGTGGVGFAFDVLLATLLIGPASVLMGGTIPILTQGLSRSLEDATRFHAFVYAFNTAGAFFGALAAGFWLVPALGLVRVMLAMGCINLFAGSVFMIVGLRGRDVISLGSDEGESSGGRLEGFTTYVFVALLTGFAMMTIQTSAIRVAGLSFGSSQFTFSMVVAVFVLCIALGSFLVSALSAVPTWLILANQWALAIFFVLLYPRLDESPYWIWALRTLFQSTDAAFTVYYLAGFIAILGVLGLPVMFSGAALPLLFHHMRRQVDHLGDLAGTLYSWNTVGSLLGALVGGYLLFFWLDLHGVFRVAIVALLVAAVLLTVQIQQLDRRWVAALVPMVVVVYLMPAWDPALLHAGLFRNRDPLPFAWDGIDQIRESQPNWLPDNIISAEDDPIVSVTVRQWDRDGVESLSISTNGKSDGDSLLDYTTMGLVAVLSAMLADDPRAAFVIGWGTGVTAGELASFDSIERVDVAEISPGVMNAAPLFDFADLGASRNPKIHVVESDAYRALMRSDDVYDIVISEPSNPWVAGVEMLFSREFLEAAKSKLSEGGVYCQWFHQYEVDDATVELVLRTYREVFDHVAVWRAGGADLMLLGFNKEGPALDHYRLEARAEKPDYATSLRRSGVRSFAGLLAHEILPLGVVHAATLEGPVHTLYHPILSDLAGRAFYRDDAGLLPFTGYGEAARIGHRNSMARAWFERMGDSVTDQQRADYLAELCMVKGPSCQLLLSKWLEATPDSPALHRLQSRLDVSAVELVVGDTGVASHLFDDGTAAADAGPISSSEAFGVTDLFVRTYRHAEPYSPDALESLWGNCRQSPPPLEVCQRTVAARLGASADSAAFDQGVDACRSRLPVGRICQDGAQQVREMLETGRLPALLEHWRVKRERDRGKGA